MVLLIDNYDSFTYMLRDYVRQAGEECIVVRNDEMTLAGINTLDFDSIIISPGPRSPDQAGITPDIIRAFYDSIPILGICLGHQAIGQVFGAALTIADKPMHGKTSLMKHGGHPIFEGIPDEIEVMRYHSLILRNLPPELEMVAETVANGQRSTVNSQQSAADGQPSTVNRQPSTDPEIMAVAHTKYKVVGLQFHPESILTPYGLQIVRNWFKYISGR